MDNTMDENQSEEIKTEQQVEGEEVTPLEEEWDLNPQLPEESELLYPGQEMLELEQEFFDDEKQEDKLWQARTGLNEDTLCGAIETVIFMSEKPIAINKIKTLIDEDMPLRVIHQAITRLQEEYESKHHGLRLVEVAEGYQFRTKATYSKYVQDLFKVNSMVLSPTALEVLAIIAYRQPVGKPDVDKIRGVDSGHIIRGLMDKRLVRIMGRSDEMGRPVLYGTTPDFLEVFNLADLSHLPPESDLEESIENNVGKITDIRTIVQEGDKSRFVFDDIDELDELANSIKSIASETDFTSALKSSEKAKLSESEDTQLDLKPQSAFDILEAYVSRQLIADANKDSLASEMIVESADPLVISDLEAGPFNVPEVDEDDDFQMIDLDTGLPIEEESDGQMFDAIDLLKKEEEEAEELAKALDEAFEKLTGEKLKDEDELELDEKSLEEKEEILMEKVEEASRQAKDLDIDLDFLDP